MTADPAQSPNDSLSQDVVLNLLARRLTCSIETLDFLFEQKEPSLPDAKSLLIPDCRLVSSNV